ncbi:aminotransferase class V-fold PLP-dependent enzyme [Sphingobacterium paludis]|uniref:Selenocysteine lyase/cysteine desulfurase n=1 Tax=Sphingobacterium paludis TaxID=1476465 RepID=A0A4R7D222_9SPHI|nr:aminotransferase class V-fold PLP-dependent enzyme [Sphingobacterium paludis]TDS14091.1 selenocysteine lyase/cysteine desulfurase [Sphingobacterium paludis]
MHFKQYFDIPQGINYLNTPGNGLVPTQVHAWRAQREQAFFEPDSLLRNQQGELIQSVREAIGQAFDVNSQQVFCTPNFSFGYSTLLDRLPADTKFLLLDEDYPSLNYPVINRRFPHQHVVVDADLETHIWEAFKQFKPDVFALSIVQYISGMKIDLDFIKELKQAYPNVLIIGDGTQYLGTEPFSFNTSGFDALGGSGYKWLMSGFGNGFLLLSEQFMRALEKGLTQVPRPQEAMWEQKSILQTFFEPGHQDTLSHGTLGESSKFLTQLGFEQIRNHIQHLSQFAHEELAGRHLLLPEIAARESRSSLINIQLPQVHYQSLMDAGIMCFPRGSGIRIGLHLYNTEEDVQHLLEHIDGFKNKHN